VSYSSHTDTDANGKYSLNVGNGDWDVSVNCGNGGDGLQNIYTNGNAQCPSDQFINVNSANTNANFLIQLTGGAIFGYVVDTFGNPIAGVDVDASDGLGDNFTGTTANNGFYSIFVGDNSWTVSVDCGELNALGYQCVADDNVTISDANSEADFQAQFSTSPTQSVFPFETLYGFSAFTVNGTNSDGANPYGGLALFGNTLYGTTSDGGTNNNGTIFGVATNLSGFTVAHTFTAANFNPQGSYTNSDGVNSYAGLVLFSNVFYGTAANGGTNGSGTVFKLSPNGTGFVTLRAFAALVKTNAQGFYTNADGANPSAGLIAYGGVLYGTTSDGGTNGSGTVFAVNTNGSGFQVLHNFTAGDVVTGTNTDGAVPYAGLVLVGNFLYGTAYFGGTNGGGTVFRLNTNGSGFATLYSFTGGDDGGSPRTTLVSSGNTLFGTAEGRGVWGNGTVFALNTNGTGFTILHSFTGGNDGYQPDEGLLLSSNILYGATYGGGNGGQGTLFALNTNTLDLTVLYSFTGGNDGANPDSSLLLLQNTLYGTAVNGGPNGNGTVFAISLTPLPPAPIVSSLGFSHGQFQMFVNNTATQTCTVQMSTNLLSTNWFSLLVTNPPAGSFLFTDTSATNKQRFYRVKIGP
ncbi:MAG TPA: choice-of-anchor tandem repeat GloVer-containing protein, partial [Candidatus Acidoferrum sp.]|nr:choice-of-anchor tandem repeat GloVer-containing protein [Candidatus Acidoferrum sp.]